MKIMMSLPIEATAHVGDTGVENGSMSCFPDIHGTDWFAVYICSAKDLHIINGYPDGLFHPERSVNYAEALKILGNLYHITAEVPPGNPWYVPYREGAYAAGVGLPAMQADMAHFLTRGEMARLAAAYVANSRGELALYRSAERGVIVSSLSSSSSSSAPFIRSSSLISQIGHDPGFS